MIEETLCQLERFKTGRMSLASQVVWPFWRQISEYKSTGGETRSPATIDIILPDETYGEDTRNTGHDQNDHTKGDTSADITDHSRNRDDGNNGKDDNDERKNQFNDT